MRKAEVVVVVVVLVLVREVGGGNEGEWVRGKG